MKNNEKLRKELKDIRTRWLNKPTKSVIFDTDLGIGISQSNIKLKNNEIILEKEISTDRQILSENTLYELHISFPLKETHVLEFKTSKLGTRLSDLIKLTLFQYRKIHKNKDQYKTHKYDIDKISISGFDINKNIIKPIINKLVMI